MKALAQLGEQRPGDPKAVAKVLVDALLEKTSMAQFAASRSTMSLLKSHKPDLAFAAAVAAHGERLLSGAEARMAELTNPPLEVLSAVSLASGPQSKRLLALLAPKKKFRRYTVAALANCRPLTAEIRAAVLAEASGTALVQQDLAIALGNWPASDLAGEDIERALALLFDSDLGNVPGKVIQIARNRGQPCPILAQRMQEIMDDQVTATTRWSQALECYGASAGQEAEEAMVSRLLEQDPARDPDRFAAVLRFAGERKKHAAAWKDRLLVVIKDETQSWWVRSHAAEIVAGVKTDGPDAALVSRWADRPAWIVQVDSAGGWPRVDANRCAAEAVDEDARLAWSIALTILDDLETAKKDPNFYARQKSLEVASISRWATAHPGQASHPITVSFLLSALSCQYAPTPADRKTCSEIMTTILAKGILDDAELRPLRYPQGGPTAMRNAAYEALVGAGMPERTSRTEKQDPPLLVGRCDAARRLHAASAPRTLLLLADREVANSVRIAAKEAEVDAVRYRQLMVDSRFSLVPVDDCLKGMHYRGEKRPAPR